MLPRASYFQALAALTGPQNPEWHTIVAGLVALRLVDDWLDFGRQVVSQQDRNVTVVRELIDRIKESNLLNKLLVDIVDIVEQAEQVSVRAITPSLLNYARALEYQGKLVLVHDILAPLQHRAEQTGDAATTILTSLRLGLNYRKSGCFDSAHESYNKAIHYAHKINATQQILFAQIGRGLTAAIQGEVDFAETAFADVVTKAHTLINNKLLGNALQSQAFLATLQNEHRNAIGLLYRALEYAPSHYEHDTMKADLASALLSAGHLSTAKDINIILAVTSQQQQVRWHATNNLMCASIIERNQPAFDLYRLALATIPLPPFLEIVYRLDSVEGYRVFGYEAEARMAYAQARTFAEHHQIHTGYWT